MSKSVVKQGQCFMDKVIALSGDWENAPQMAIANNVSITDNIDSGAEVKVAAVTSPAIAKAMGSGGATKVHLTDAEKEEGIEFWAIEIDFIIS